MTSTTSDSPDFLLDSNIIVYAYDARETAKRARAIEVVTRLADVGRGAVSVQLLGEVYVSLTKRSRLEISADEVRDVVEKVADAFPVLDLTRLTAEEAIRLCGRYQLVYWDCLILAAAKLAGIRHVLSEDMQDGQVVEGVRILNPLLPSFDMSLLG